MRVRHGQGFLLRHFRLRVFTRREKGGATPLAAVRATVERSVFSAMASRKESTAFAWAHGTLSAPPQPRSGHHKSSSTYHNTRAFRSSRIAGTRTTLSSLNFFHVFALFSLLTRLSFPIIPSLSTHTHSHTPDRESARVPPDRPQSPCLRARSGTRRVPRRAQRDTARRPPGGNQEKGGEEGEGGGGVIVNRRESCWWRGCCSCSKRDR